MKMKSKILSFLLLVGATQAAEPLVYEGEEGIGKGKHIVFLANDHEYRSEQTCPLMDKILAKHHGFRCTVLFGLNEEGEIKPGAKSVPGLEDLESADMLFFFARFMNLPDAQVEHLASYFEKGGPALGLRTSTHCFNGQEGQWSKFNYNYKGEDYFGGVGKQIFGLTWGKKGGQGHYGANHAQGSRMIAVENSASHPILTGVSQIHAYSGAYSSPVPAGATSLLNVQVLRTFEPSDKIAENKPLEVSAWCRDSYTAPSGEKKDARNFYASFGAGEDMVDENTRRLFANATLWAMGMEESITPTLKVDIVGEFYPTPYYNGSYYYKGVKPADLAAWDSAIMPQDAEVAGLNISGKDSEKKKKKVARVLKNRPKMAERLMPKAAEPAEAH